MEKIEKYKYVLTTLAFSGIISLFALYLRSRGYYFGAIKGMDFYVQHSFYMDYFRENLYQSRDMLPDLGMNLGMMQNFATFYYYGVFNIFIRGFALFPMFDAYEYQFIINILVYTLTFYFMTRLLKYLGFEYKYVVLGSTLVSLASAFTMLSARMPMYSYTYMFFILALLGLAKLIKEDKVLLFTISNIFIITSNLFQIQTTGLFALVFYVFYALYLGVEKGVIKRSLMKVFMSYAISLGICALVIIPQVFLYANGSRYELNEVVLPNLINFNSISQFVITYFTFGFAFLSAALLVSLFFIRKRYIVIPTLMLLIIFESVDIAYVFNLFAIEPKVFLYSAPVVTVLILFMLKEVKNMEIKSKVSITVIATVLYFIVSITNEYGRNFYMSHAYYLTTFDAFEIYRNKIFLVMIITVYLIYILFIFDLNKHLKSTLFVILILSYTCTTLIYNAIFTDLEYVNGLKDTYKFVNDQSEEFSLYRTNDSSSDTSQDFRLSRNEIYTYTSFINPYYDNYFYEYTDLPRGHWSLAFSSFRTSDIIDRVLSIEGENTTKPMIYGSYNVLDFSEWMNIEKSLRIAASLQGPSVDYDSNANHIPFDIMNEITLVGEYDSHYFTNSETNIFPEFNERNGEYIIVAEVKDENQVTMYVNGKRNVKTFDASRYYNGNDIFTFYVPTDGSGIEVNLLSDDIELNNIKVYHISEEAINSYENEYVIPDNFKTDYNDGFNFDITMEQDGILATTIPFDDGYKILVDGKEVETQLIDGTFIGAEISKGTHKVEIIYTTPGKNLGIIISSISILGFLYLLKKKKIK